MLTLVDVLLEHGVEVSEAELAEATEDGFGWVLTGLEATALPVDEATLLDAAGLSDEPGAYARSAVAAAGAYAALVASALTVGEAARLLGVTEGRVRHKIARRDLSALPSGRRRLPRWQFTDNGALPGLSVVLRALDQHEHPLATLAFITSAQPELALDGETVTPQDWLRAGGDPTPVAELAAGRL